MLHNLSLEKKPETQAQQVFKTVVRLGFEPGQAEPKSAVLPLHHRTISAKRIAKVEKNPFVKILSDFFSTFLKISKEMD